MEVWKWNPNPRHKTLCQTKKRNEINVRTFFKVLPGRFHFHHFHKNIKSIYITMA